jgi:ABC-type lipoprotein release transport system permease subunit
VRLFSIVAVFILLIACINFINLTTARSVRRSREIGIRKVTGAFRLALVRQFIGEAMVFVVLSAMVSIALVFWLLPAFNALTGKQMTVPFHDLRFLLALAVLVVVTGFVSGSYPAFYLSSFNPVRVLKGTFKSSPSALWLRKGLVVFQFMLSIVLIIGTIVVTRQVRYVQNVNLGYDRENLLYIPLEGELSANYQLFKQEALKAAGVKEISRITHNPTKLEASTGGVQWEGKDPTSTIQFTPLGVGYDFMKTMKLKMAAGRDFSKDFATDSASYIINEAALRIIGYRDPLGKPLTFWQKPGRIIGVVRDFHFNSLHVPINPMVMRLTEIMTDGTALVRTEAGKTQQALKDLEKLCKELNPQFPFSFTFSDEEYQKLYKSEAIVGKLSNCFAFLAIFISCLGLLGLAMFTAQQRTKEFGIRKVLGASAASLFQLLSKEFLILVMLALLLACPLAWYFMHNWLLDYAYRVNLSWWMFALAGFAAVLIALATVGFQAGKAAITNPVKSLRTE